MARSLPKTFGRLSTMGSRPETAVFKTMNLIFFLMAIFFSIVYFIVASTDEVGSNGDHLKDDLTNYLVVISALCVALLVMEFYFSLTSAMKMFRLACVVTLFVFIAMSIPKAQDLGSSLGNNGSNAGGDALVYTFASLALGFAGVAALVNGLEVLKNSGY